MENESEFPEVKRSDKDLELLGLYRSEPYVAPRYLNTEIEISLVAEPSVLNFGNMSWTPSEEIEKDPFQLNHLLFFVTKSQMRKLKRVYVEWDYENAAFFKTLRVSLKNRANAARRRKAKQRKK